MATIPKIQQEIDFANEMAQTDLLSRAIDWITSNLHPEDIFGQETLDNWALCHRFKRLEDHEDDNYVPF